MDYQPIIDQTPIVERIAINEQVMYEGNKGDKTASYWVKCPKMGREVGDHCCQACEHCRMMYAKSIACGYKRDQFRLRNRISTM